MQEEYIKNFDAWNIKKKTLQSRGFDDAPFYEGEIWWCSIGINLGSEEDGKNEFFERPVLVVRKFNKDLAWILPITTKHKINSYYLLLEKSRDSRIDNSVILSQLRVVSVKRFQRFVRRISLHEFTLLHRRLLNLLKYQ